MGKKIFINNKYNSFKKTITVDGDKSISIRALLLGSQAYGKSFIENILLSEDIINQLNREGWPVCPGDLGENLTLTNIDYSSILPGQNYTIGNIEIMISFICDPCSYLEVLPYVGELKLIDFIKTLKNRRGWDARVVKEGQIFAGDLVNII